MQPGYQYDDWYSTTPLDTPWNGELCSAPNGYGFQGTYPPSCSSTSCPLHDMCPAGSYCGVAGHFDGIKASHWDIEGTDKVNKWRDMLVQDMTDEVRK